MFWPDLSPARGKAHRSSKACRIRTKANDGAPQAVDRQLLGGELRHMLMAPSPLAWLWRPITKTLRTLGKKRAARRGWIGTAVEIGELAGTRCPNGRRRLGSEKVEGRQGKEGPSAAMAPSMSGSLGVES